MERNARHRSAQKLTRRCKSNEIVTRWRREKNLEKNHSDVLVHSGWKKKLRFVISICVWFFFFSLLHSVHAFNNYHNFHGREANTLARQSIKINKKFQSTHLKKKTNNTLIQIITPTPFFPECRSRWFFVLFLFFRRFAIAREWLS